MIQHRPAPRRRRRRRVPSSATRCSTCPRPDSAPEWRPCVQCAQLGRFVGTAAFSARIAPPLEQPSELAVRRLRVDVPFRADRATVSPDRLALRSANRTLRVVGAAGAAADSYGCGAAAAGWLSRPSSNGKTTIPSWPPGPPARTRAAIGRRRSMRSERAAIASGLSFSH